MVLYVRLVVCNLNPDHNTPIKVIRLPIISGYTLQYMIVLHIRVNLFGRTFLRRIVKAYSFGRLGSINVYAR